jgi:hypothetical protein
MEFYATMTLEPEGAAILGGCVFGILAVALAFAPVVREWWWRR